MVKVGTDTVGAPAVGTVMGTPEVVEGTGVTSGVGSASPGVVGLASGGKGVNSTGAVSVGSRVGSAGVAISGVGVPVGVGSSVGTGFAVGSSAGVSAGSVTPAEAAGFVFAQFTRIVAVELE